MSIVQFQVTVEETHLGKQETIYVLNNEGQLYKSVSNLYNPSLKPAWTRVQTPVTPVKKSKVVNLDEL